MSFKDMEPKAALVDDANFYFSFDSDYVSPSFILSFLIRKAGTECEAYASDLFISWNSFMKKVINLSDSDDCVEWFGFRKCGVDHKAFIDCRADERMGDNKYAGIYSSVYAVEAARNGDELYFWLYRVYDPNEHIEKIRPSWEKMVFADDRN